MCSVSLSEQEASQIDTVTVAIVSTTVAEAVKTSNILVTDGAGELDYMHYVEA